MASSAKPAHATFSVLLTNTRTHELGGAVTSCVGAFDLATIFATVVLPGGQQAAVFTQSWFSETNHQRAQVLLAAGEELSAVVAQLTDPSFDPDFADRQYHLLSTDGTGTTWTGANAGAFAGGMGGSFDEWSFTVAGNILTSERVLTALERSLRSSSGAMEQRLVRALEAVEAIGEGDSRCIPLPGDSAFVGVVDANGVHTSWVSNVNTAPQSAVQRLRVAVGVDPGEIDAEPGQFDAGGVAADAAMPPSRATTSDEPAVSCSSGRHSGTLQWVWLEALVAVGWGRRWRKIER